MSSLVGAWVFIFGGQIGVQNESQFLGSLVNSKVASSC
jgi:hypothetical protein